MKLTRSPYAVLGVSPDTPPEGIKKAYRRLANRYHPDKQDTGDEDKFKELNAAYEILSDPERRKMYDEHGVTTDHGVNVMKNCQELFVEAVLKMDQGNSPLQSALNKIKDETLKLDAQLADATLAKTRLSDAVQRLKPSSEASVAQQSCLIEALNIKLEEVAKATARIKYTLQLMVDMKKYFSACTWDDTGLTPPRRQSVSEWAFLDNYLGRPC